MRGAENILKSMRLAGVEWELAESQRSGDCTEWNSECEARGENKLHTSHSTFHTPKTTAPVSNASIMETAHRLAATGDVCAFHEHPLYQGAKNTVVPVIPGGAKLLVITDIPSLADDASGKVLSGAEGELFDKMMAAIGLSRGEIAITPLVFWRPAGGRTPTGDELAFCRPFVDKIIRDLAPRKILVLGGLAANEIIGATLPRDLGKKFENMMPIYKPDFILQNPDVKKGVWEALKSFLPEAC